MKRLVFVLALALVLVLGVAATAHADTAPPGTYRLNIVGYWDADNDGMWDDCEPPLSGVSVWLTGGFEGWAGPTDFCGRGHIHLPAGITVYSSGGTIQPWPYDKLPAGMGYTTEAAPMKSDTEPWTAKAVMKGNRCMAFGIGAKPFDWCIPQCVPDDCVITPDPCVCEPCPDTGDCTCEADCKCVPDCKCGCKYH